MRPLSALILLAACGSDIKVSSADLCDGVQQEGETYVDAGFDRDGDGYYDGNNPDCRETYDASVLDCNDGSAEVYPSNAETTCNGIDDDCDETTRDDADLDGDHFNACEECDDNDSSINPAHEEEECNGKDDDCNSTTQDGPDPDGDGYTACDDCDEARAEVNPGGYEITCDGLDNDCNAETPDGYDNDGDTFEDCPDQDCDDSDANINPGHDEECDNGIDDDCDGDYDENCDIDYSGYWDLDDRIRYSCAYGFVSLNFTQVFVVDASPDFAISSDSGSQPGTMTGSLSGDTFSVENTLMGSCDEIYTMEGSFTDENTFTATFTADFVGSCFDCSTQTWDVTGTR